MPCSPTNVEIVELSPSERKLGQLVALFPPEGTEKFVLRHLWTDYLREPATALGKETFYVALRKLIRLHVVFVDEMGDSLLMTPSNRDLLREDLGDELPGEAYRVSDFLSAWIGFSPFDFRQKELRRIAETSPLGQSLVEELDMLKALHAEQAGIRDVPLETALENGSPYRPGADAIPLEWANFLENGDNRVFADRDLNEVAQEFRNAFSRRHWVYAFQQRGYGLQLDKLFAEEIRNWNFFDRLACLREGAAPSSVLFADRPEWKSEAEAILGRLEPEVEN